MSSATLGARKRDMDGSLIFFSLEAEDRELLKSQAAGLAAALAAFFRIMDLGCWIQRSLGNLNKNTFSGETHLELPKFQLPTFSGDISDWLSFKEIFIRSINQNPTLGNFQKLQYLNSALKGKCR
ncbi:hypothetical protein LAZ67_15001031 [Cordylochernes scorpioides]|uniref:Uncharacterized protein n=1 Tax=Cordylochernes scorpioides TaxID=51811 RepID=A0ABY6L8G2_9ARAC|nr:hypothetical protein LAZ67_15001031 [Cordylochernes scorpioides]